MDHGGVCGATESMCGGEDILTLTSPNHELCLMTNLGV